MKKFVNIILAFILLFTSVMPINAADASGEVAPEISIYKYNGSGEYIPFDSANNTATYGELLLVRVSFNQEVSSLATLRVTLEFSQDKLTYMKGSFHSELVPGDVNAGDPVVGVSDGAVKVFYGKGNLVAQHSVEILGGASAKSIAYFVFSCQASSGTGEIKATIDNVLSGSFEQLSMEPKSVTSSVTFAKMGLQESRLGVFESLKDIVYDPENASVDSKANIEAADAVYNTFTEAEKLYFASEYPKFFKYYQTAWTRYYDASLEATLGQLRAEIKHFYEENQEVLDNVKSAEQVNRDNYELVLSAISSYGKMTAQAQIQTEALAYKKQLDGLEEAAKAIEASVKEDLLAQESFIDAYMSNLWNSTPEDITTTNYGGNEDGGGYMVLVAEALGAYDFLEQDLLSDEMKKKVASYYQKLLQLNERITEVAKEAGEDAKIQEEIIAFTSKWHAVTKLNIMSVGVKDQSALEMYLQDFASLSETAQQRLSTRKTAVEQLLTYVKGLASNQSNAGSAVTPQGGTTNEVIKEIQVPVETVTTQTNSFLRSVPRIVYILIILMGITILLGVIPLVVYLVYRKNKSKLKGDNS